MPDLVRSKRRLYWMARTTIPGFPSYSTEYSAPSLDDTGYERSRLWVQWVVILGTFCECMIWTNGEEIEFHI